MKNILNSNVYLDDMLLRKTLLEYDVEYLFDCINEQIIYTEFSKNYDNDGCDFIPLELFNRGISILINYASYVKRNFNKNVVIPKFEINNTDIVISFEKDENIKLRFILFDNSNYMYITYYNDYCFLNNLEINISQILDEIKPLDEIFILFPIVFD